MASILDRRFILVTGKGGVGRSTVAAAIAAAAARRGRRTLLYQASANDRFGGFFGKAPVGTAIVRLDDDLYAVNTNPAAALEEYGLMVLRFKRVYKMVFENRITKYFLRAIPGLDDYSVLGKAWYHTTETSAGRPTWDTLVFDMPASGHTLSMLGVPKVILDTVPEGPLTRDARLLQDLLRDPARTALVLVTLAEEMPANEAHELTTALYRQLGIQVAHLIINQVYPDDFPAGSPQAAILDALTGAANLAGPLAALVGHADLQVGRRRLNETYIRQLRATIPAAQSQLPFLFAPSLGQAEIQALSQLVEERLGGAVKAS
jgi:anion-transporting  ArsA/GET3 family ATPase